MEGYQNNEQLQRTLIVSVHLQCVDMMPLTPVLLWCDLPRQCKLMQKLMLAQPVTAPACRIFTSQGFTMYLVISVEASTARALSGIMQSQVSCRLTD